MSGTFYKWLIGDLGNEGEFAYKAIHLYSVIAVLILLAAVLFLAAHWRKNEKKGRGLILAIAWFHLGFEVLWRLVYVFVKGAALKDLWPLYPCNLGGVLLPLIAIFRWQTGKKMFYLFGLVGALLTFGYPDGIFCRDVMSFPILKSVLQHTGLLMLPLTEMVLGDFRPGIRHMGWVTGGCVVHCINSELVSVLLDMRGDYMFFRSGLPFVIPGVPQYITFSVFGLGVFALLLILCDWIFGKKTAVKT